MEIVELMKNEGDAVKMVKALIDAAEVAKIAPDGAGLFVVYVYEGDPEIVSYANVSDGEIIEACCKVMVRYASGDED